MTATPPDLPDPAVVRRAFDRAADTYDDAAILQGRVRDELLERLDVVRFEPARILDLGTGSGLGAAALKQRYRKAEVTAVDFAPRMLAIAAKRSRWRRRIATVHADAVSLPFANEAFDLVFSNMMLPYCADPDRVFREARRVLAPNGLLTFTTVGPDTLSELRDGWTGIDDSTHVLRFIDMHDIGDALVRAGFAEPVMDVDRYTVTYETLDALLKDLKRCGATNATVGRPRGLTGSGRLATLANRYERHRVDGRLPATCEVIFGHAWAPTLGAVRNTDAGGVTEVPVDRISRRRRSDD